MAWNLPNGSLYASFFSNKFHSSGTPVLTDLHRPSLHALPKPGRMHWECSNLKTRLSLMYPMGRQWLDKALAANGHRKFFVLPRRVIAMFFSFSASEGMCNIKTTTFMHSINICQTLPYVIMTLVYSASIKLVVSTDVYIGCMYMFR